MLAWFLLLALIPLGAVVIFVQRQVNQTNLDVELQAPVLLYPADDAVPITRFAASERPIVLIVPDRSWRQAGKMRKRIPGLAAVPCVTLPDAGPTEYHLRAEVRAGGVRLVLRVPAGLAGLDLGSSLAVNGTCLTVVETSGGTLAFDAVGATLKRTLLSGLRAGAKVNLERSLRLGVPVDGHLVTGHVDGVGTVVSRRPGEGAIWFGIEAPEDLVPQIAPPPSRKLRT